MEPCGGILEGDTGQFQYSPDYSEDDGGDEAKNCIWLVQASGATKILLTVSDYVPTRNNSLVLYPEHVLGDKCLNPIT